MLKIFFSAETCACEVIVKKNGEVLFSAKTSDAQFTKTKNSFSFSYTFPEIALYTVEVKSSDFTFAYDIRVDEVRDHGHEDGSVQNLFIHHWLHLILFGGVFIFGIILTIRQKLQGRV